MVQATKSKKTGKAKWGGEETELKQAFKARKKWRGGVGAKKILKKE